MSDLRNWMDDAVRGAALPALVALVSSCATLSPGESLPTGAQPVEAPVEYAAWWSATESCSQLSGSYDRVEWYVVPGVSSFPTEVGEKVGLWIRSGSRRQIVIAERYLEHEMVVRHEMLHALMKRGTHPSQMFVGACHLASARVWRDSTLVQDPGNPEGH